MNETEKQDLLSDLKFLQLKIDLSKIEKAISKLQTENPFLYADFCKSNGEGFSIDDDLETITKDPSRIKEKPLKEWDEVNERWVTQKGRVVTPYDKEG